MLHVLVLLDLGLGFGVHVLSVVDPGSGDGFGGFFLLGEGVGGVEEVVLRGRFCRLLLLLLLLELEEAVTEQLWLELEVELVLLLLL